MARERALENARAIADGRDPRGGSPRGVPTFAEALETVIAIHAENWKDRSSSEHQWRATLTTYAFPRIGSTMLDLPFAFGPSRKTWRFFRSIS